MKGRDFTRAEPYAEAARALPDGAEWLSEGRSGAAEALVRSGFPGRDEAWKYTRASKLLQEAFVPVVGAPASVELPAGPWDGHRCHVFVDGLPTELPPSERPDRLGEALGDVEGFTALNVAFARAGVVLTANQDGPVHLVHVSTGANRLGAVRHLVVVEDGATIELVEHFLTLGEGPGLTTATTEVLVGAGATVDHVRVVDEGAAISHVGTVAATVAASGSFRFFSAIVGGDLVRVDARVRLEGEGASTDLVGLSLLRGRQHADQHVVVDHAVPNTKSDQLFRSVLDDRSRSVYTGVVIVREGALGTDSAQLHHALLLSDDAIVNARPWLEILADDVRCAHGAAIGSLDPDALFYLRQRGLGPSDARALLTWGFAAEVLDRLPAGAVRDALDARASAWMDAR